MNLLALLVIFAAIFAFFLDEFTRLFKKIIANKWMVAIVSLLIISSLIVVYDSITLTLLLHFESYFRYWMLFVFQTLPYKTWAGFFAQFIVLFFVASIPAWCIYAVLSYRQSHYTKVWFTYTYFYFWIFLVMLWAA